MRAMLAALIDTSLAALVGFVAFHLAVLTAPCSNLGACTILTPLVLLFVTLGLILYFGLGFALWRTTPGKALLRLDA